MLKSIIKKLASKLGYLVVQKNHYSLPESRLIKMLTQHGVKTILDVGANEGQFALAVMESGFNGDIVSFEAIPSVHRKLVAAASNYGAKWSVNPACAIGDSSGTHSFNVTQFSPSSSLLKPTDQLMQISREKFTSEAVEVPVERLDTVYQILHQTSVLFLKIDVQGAEMQVLKGADKLFKNIAGVMVEMSLETLYENQALFNDIDEVLRARGYSLNDITPLLRDDDTGRLLQFDATYFRAQKDQTTNE